MPHHIPTVTTSELVARIERGDDQVLVNTLGAEAFDEEHIPTSVSVPGMSDDFVDRVLQLAGSKDRSVVVYCSSRACATSLKAARKLAQAGFTKVAHYADGIAGWKLGGYELESAEPSRPRR